MKYKKTAAAVILLTFFNYSFAYKSFTIANYTGFDMQREQTQGSYSWQLPDNFNNVQSFSHDASHDLASSPFWSGTGYKIVDDHGNYYGYVFLSVDNKNIVKCSTGDDYQSKVIKCDVQSPNVVYVRR